MIVRAVQTRRLLWGPLCSYLGFWVRETSMEVEFKGIGVGWLIDSGRSIYAAAPTLVMWGRGTVSAVWQFWPCPANTAGWLTVGREHSCTEKQFSKASVWNATWVSVLRY